MSVPLRYRRRHGASQEHEQTSQNPQYSAPYYMQQQPLQHYPQPHMQTQPAGHYPQQYMRQQQQHVQYPQQSHPQAYLQYSHRYQPGYPQQNYSHQQNYGPNTPISPTSPQSPVTPQSPSLGQQATVRKPRPYDRADRTRGRIVEPEREFAANKDAIDKLIASTAGAMTSASTPSPQSSDSHATDLQRNASPAQRYNSPKASSNMPENCAVTVRLPSRKVIKHTTSTTTARDLALSLVKEHRLEFDFEYNNEGDGDEIILWEWIDGIRRPLRNTEMIGPIVKRWSKWGQQCYLRTTSTSLRNDVDSLASLVPRRDMLRTPPKIQAASVQFSRPSVIYNPNFGGIIRDPRSPTMSPSLDGSPNLNRSDSKNKHNANLGNDNYGGGSDLRRIPSKLNPNDKGLRVKRIQADNDDVALHTQLVWGFGTLELENGKLIVKQTPGDELVCCLETSGTDIYEWPHAGPRQYVAVLRAQQTNSRAIYLSTDSPKVFSILRNAIFTARTKDLMTQQFSRR